MVTGTATEPGLAREALTGVVMAGGAITEKGVDHAVSC